MGLLTRMVEDRQPGRGWLDSDPPDWAWPPYQGELLMVEDLIGAVVMMGLVTSLVSNPSVPAAIRQMGEIFSTAVRPVSLDL